RFRAGHRIRLSLSTSYWPMILPPPTDPGLTIDTGSLSLSLPLLGDHREIVVPQPANPNPLPTYIDHSPAKTRRTVERDMTKGVTHYRIYEDTGLVEHPDTGNATQDIRDEVWSIAPGDPHSMTGVSTWTCIAKRDEQSLRTVSTSRLGCSETEWITSAKVEAFEGEEKIFEKTFEKRIRRDFM
ncbi:CocE/NonD family hydrolase C-terminal non-catalytic domain-containing protein, partial [Sinorhizobium fredii]